MIHDGKYFNPGFNHTDFYEGINIFHPASLHAILLRFYIQQNPMTRKQFWGNENPDSGVRAFGGC